MNRPRRATQLAIRPASFPADFPTIRALDTSFTTGVILSAVVDEDGFRLAPVKLSQPLTKTLPVLDLGDSDQSWEFAIVATAGELIVGFAAAELQNWNKRLVLSHLYVDSGSRRLGIGRALIDVVLQYAATVGANHLWAETSNLNVPAIAAYRRWGFELCGLDTTLYQGTPAAGETALFLSRTV